MKKQLLILVILSQFAFATEDNDYDIHLEELVTEETASEVDTQRKTASVYWLLKKKQENNSDSETLPSESETISDTQTDSTSADY